MVSGTRLHQEQVQRNIARFMNNTLPKTQAEFLELFAKEAVREASLICPVDTGNLRSTIRPEVPAGLDPSKRIDVVAGGKQGVGRTPKEVNYAKWVHDGHHTRGGGSYIVGRPFLRIGAERASRRLGDIVKVTKLG